MTIQSVAPFLAQHAVPRTGDDVIPGAYCANRHLWMVADQPIINLKSIDIGLATKTAAQVESDDETFQTPLLEATTKTLSAREEDDTAPGFSLLELATKTETMREDDD